MSELEAPATAELDEHGRPWHLYDNPSPEQKRWWRSFLAEREAQAAADRAAGIKPIPWEQLRDELRRSELDSTDAG